MAENENTPPVTTENEKAETPAAEPAPEVRTTRERPPRAERVKPERPPRVKPEREARVKPEREPRVKPEREPRVKPERPVRERAGRVRTERPPKAERVRPERPKPARPPFEFGLGLDLGKEFDRVMKAAFNDAARSVEEQLTSLLAIPPDTDPNDTREMDRVRKTVAKTIGKALGTFGSRLIPQGPPSFSSLTRNEDGTRVTAGPLPLQLSPASASRFVSQVSALRPYLIGEEPPLKKFAGQPQKLEAAYGNSLENNYFLTGSAGFAPNFGAPEDTEFTYSLDLFAKRGKQMGMRLQFSVRHNLDPASFTGELRVEIPLQAAEAAAPAKKVSNAKPPKSE